MNAKTVERVDIILIEDDSGQVELTLRAFRKNNLQNEVKVLRDGAEALAYFTQNTHKPRLILLDLKLPKMSGLDVLRYLKSDPYWRGVPVIILTTSDKEKDMQACYDLGANSYITKPIQFTEFVESVKGIGMYWLLLNRV